MQAVLTLRKRIKVSPRCRTKGFTLIELLIAMFILAFGLLGVAALQGQAFRATGMGGATSIANQIARNVADRVLRNAANVGAYDGMNTATTASPNCPIISPAPVCAQDFSDWQNAITSLPQGGLQIASVVGANFSTVTATVSWNDAMGSHSVVLPVQVAP